MMVKRYVVEDIPEAVVMIRRELGKDAVILSTRKVTQKQWLGLWRRKRIEVLAAAGADMPISTSYSKQAQVSSAGARVPESGESTEQVVLTETEDAPSNDASSVLTQPRTRATESVSQDVQELRSEFASMKAALQSFLEQSRESAAANAMAGYTTVAGTSAVQDQLRRQGLEAEPLLALVSDMLGAKLRAPQGFMLSTSGQWMERVRSLIPACKSPQPFGRTARVVAFIGQTGVGKTTTIAKIAALQMLTGLNKVGLITSDTYRIAAIEQLRTYARILDVPLEVVNSSDDLSAAVEKLHDRDLILVDTAGRNYGVEEHFEETTNFLKSPVIDETHLVLSLTSKPEDLHRIIQKFASFPIDKFLFTKLDETSSYAVALELLYQYKKPFSYFTNGQNVPDDIEIGTLERLLTLILKGAA